MPQFILHRTTQPHNPPVLQALPRAAVKFRKIPEGSDIPEALMISVAAWTVFFWKFWTLNFLSTTTRPLISSGSCVAIPVGQRFVPHFKACAGGKTKMSYLMTRFNAWTAKTPFNFFLELFRCAMDRVEVRAALHSLRQNHSMGWGYFKVGQRGLVGGKHINAKYRSITELTVELCLGASEP